MSLRRFVLDRLDSQPHLRQLHHGEAGFLRWYLQQYGITEYLKSLNHQTLDHTSTLEIGLFLLEHSQASPLSVGDVLQKYETLYQLTMDIGVLNFPEASWRLLHKQLLQR